MTLLRRLATIALWVCAFAGAACGAIWAATAAGVIQPLVVISGSMEPEIMTGDLLVATKVDAADLAVGDVVSLRGALSDMLVTHRIIAIEPAQGGYSVTMRGDANEFEDPLPYAVSGEVWSPSVQIPGAGTVVTRLSTPAVAVPLLVGLIALLGLTMLLPPPPSPRRGQRPTPENGRQLAIRRAAPAAEATS